MAANRAFADKLQFPYPLVCDTDRAIGMAYGACDSATAPAARRVTYLIDPDGVIQGAWGQGAKIDVRGHADEVLRALG